MKDEERTIRDLIAQHCLAYNIGLPPRPIVDAIVAAAVASDSDAIADGMWDWFCQLQRRPGWRR